MASPMASFNSARQSGFTYLGLLLIIAVMGIVMSATSELWQSVMQHEREKELIFIGHQFRDAIGRHYKSKTGNGGYPARLEDLLQDPNAEEMSRYLRKIYTDPMTGNTEWGLVRDEDGDIRGVFSLSNEKPRKINGFDKEDICLTNRLSYSDWKFIYKRKKKNNLDEEVDCDNQ